MNIFAKLVLLLAAVAAIPPAVTAFIVTRRSADLQRDLLRTSEDVGGAIWNESNRALEAHAHKTHGQIVHTKADQLTAIFENIGRTVRLEAALVREALDRAPIAEAPPAHDADAYAEVLRANPERRGSEPYVTYWQVRGSSTPIDLTVAKLRSLGVFFHKTWSQLPKCKSIYAGHRDGFILGYPGNAVNYDAAYDPRQRPWYAKASAKRDLIWTDLYVDRDKKNYVITCAVPLPAADGSSIDAVAAVDIEMTSFLENLFDVQGIEIEDAIVFDDAGIVRIGGQLQMGSRKLDPLLTAEPKPVKDYANGSFLRLFEECKVSSAPYGVFRESDTAMFAFGTIKLGADVEWVYAAKLPVEQILRPIRAVHDKHRDSMQKLSAVIEQRVRDLWIQIFVATLVILLLVLIVATVVARSTTRPLVRMSEVAQDIGKGNLDVQVEVRSRDEIGQMGTAINEMIKGLKERNFVKDTFKRYVAGSVVDQLISDPSKLRLGGEKRELTVFFSDLANFTTLSERMEPEDLVNLVNEYLGAMTDAIWEHQGTIDKYGGDAIMAFWGAPVAQDDHARRACEAALANIERLKKLWPEWRKRGLPQLQMRIGINTGPMVVGNMGSSVKIDYTVLGDAVNLGSRLEGANKEYGTNILISEATRKAAGGAIETREIDLLAVKGRTEAVRVYELIGIAGHLSDELHRGRLSFESGLGAYRARQWDAAHAMFRRADELLGGDRASQTFLRRITEFRANPPPPDWNGTYVMKEK